MVVARRILGGDFFLRVTEIGEQIFDGCRSLKKIYCRRGTGFESILCDGNRAGIIYYDATPPAQIQPPKPSASARYYFSLGAVSWRAVESNITGVKVERGIIPDKKFFDWLGGLGSDVPVSF